MRLVYIFAAILALTVVESSDEKLYDDLEAMETMELKKEKRGLLKDASAYNYVPQQTWQNYVPQNQNNYVPNNNYATNAPYVPPVTASPPYVPPVTSSPYVPPVQSDYAPPQTYPTQQQQYYPPATWSTPNYHVSTTTTPIPVIKNEQNFGENGSYNYEYQIGDGTHVRQEGYFNDPKQSEDSLVQRGFYSYLGADGKTYTVFYWADNTGFHAYGDHLPTPPPTPPAIQAALDAEKNKATSAPPTQTTPSYYPQQPTYPTQQTKPQQTYPQQTYPQQTYPQQTYPQQTYPQQTYPQQTYPQPTYPQQTNPQQTYYPPQTANNPGYGK